MSETPTPAPAGYSFGTPMFTPSSTVTITTNGATVTVTTHNTLTRDTASVELKKHWVGTMVRRP